MGFDVEAKPNIASNPDVVALATGETTWDKWVNGTKDYKKTSDWMKNQGLASMTKKDYEKFLDDNTKEKGIYEFNVGYFYGGGHSTLLERRADGTLVRIEQQHTHKATLDNLLSQLQSLPPTNTRGIMRVDNARFNPKYSSIVMKVKKKK